MDGAGLRGWASANNEQFPNVNLLMSDVCRVLEAGYTLATGRMYSALASVSSPRHSRLNNENGCCLGL